MKKLILTSILSIFSIYCFAQPITYVKSQEDFDNIIESINVGKETSIELAQGTYTLNKSIITKAPLIIKGINATIRGTRDKYSIKDAIKNQNGHYVCKLKHPINYFGLFINNNGKAIHTSESVNKITKVNYITDKIEGTPDRTHNGIEIKIPIAENLTHLANKTFQKGYGYFDCGWSKYSFCVEYSDNNYFYCKTLDHNNVTDFSYDLTHYKQSIRYVLYNMEMDGCGIYYDDEYIYIPNSIKEVYYYNDIKSKKKATNIKIKSDFTVTGVTFDNIEDISIKIGASQKCNIEKCTFTYTLGTTLNIEKNGGENINVATIKNCSFLNCSILSGHIVNMKTDLSGVNSITLSNCTISRYPTGDVIYKNCAGSVFADGDIVLKNNVVYNTSRNLFRLRRGKILCKNNVIYNSETFNAMKDRNLSSDFGLIYCGNVFYSKPEDVLGNTNSIITLDGNLIHGSYGYHGNARGIFIDDGRGDVTCIHNVIYDTPMYSIDARHEKKFKGSCSVRVNISDNLLACPYRLQTNDNTLGDNAPISSGNILLYDKENKIKNIRRGKNDVILHNINIGTTTDNSKIRLSYADIKTLSKFPIWSSLKQHVAQ